MPVQKHLSPRARVVQEPVMVPVGCGLLLGVFPNRFDSYLIFCKYYFYHWCCFHLNVAGLSKSSNISILTIHADR